MFGLFKSVPYSDPVLGELVRSRGLWRGTLQLDSGTMKLALTGPKAAPDPAALAAARELKVSLSAWRSAIEAALFEHYEPYATAVAEGEFPEESESFPTITAPPGVWPHATLEYISVSHLGGALLTELGYATAWDDEHMLGARFADGVFVELCGSVLPP
jgi:hypothetical protein